MSLKSIAQTELGAVFAEHYDSLPMSASRRGLGRHWPWLGLFVVIPGVATAVLVHAGLSHDVAGGVLAGVGVLGGLLFSVHAWVASRMATVADGMGVQPASPYEIALLRRLDITRANVAYATFLSIAVVIGVGVLGMLKKAPHWLAPTSTFLLLHLGMTLVLLVLRINRLGKNDRITALTAHARQTS